MTRTVYISEFLRVTGIFGQEFQSRKYHRKTENQPRSSSGRRRRPRQQQQHNSAGGLVPLIADASAEVLEDRIQCTGLAHVHPGGTAAMGKVVDSEGKVLGVRGLRVADASIVPIPLGGHPQATLYAMAEQLAAFILGEYNP
ncbi:hypothetical protein PG994_007925 [Apiospora phragmitis]|uniref:Glucose-methanol-choline oxidoreductase C-terminal domain-containing protein n=1 Tax=Apiospora phragmitis TaxID=2905665 RepID=A0ABR1URK2_9PEZI